MPYADPEKKKANYRKHYAIRREKGLSTEQKRSKKLASYKTHAKERGLSFEIAPVDFNVLLVQKCHYCGIENSNGVDRKDSSLGYIAENIVPCCSVCNFMKNTQSYEEFFKRVAIIYSRHCGGYGEAHLPPIWASLQPSQWNSIETIKR